jgi:hypothetical protein
LGEIAQFTHVLAGSTVGDARVARSRQEWHSLGLMLGMRVVGLVKFPRQQFAIRNKQKKKPPSPVVLVENTDKLISFISLLAKRVST